MKNGYPLKIIDVYMYSEIFEKNGWEKVDQRHGSNVGLYDHSSLFGTTFQQNWITHQNSFSKYYTCRKN